MQLITIPEEFILASFSEFTGSTLSEVQDEATENNYMRASQRTETLKLTSSLLNVREELLHQRHQDVSESVENVAMIGVTRNKGAFKKTTKTTHWGLLNLAEVPGRSAIPNARQLLELLFLLASLHRRLLPEGELENDTH